MSALAGIKILDLSRTGPGQMSTTMLADMGAEVIAIGQPGFAQRRAAGGSASPLFALNVGRNKRGILIDLRNEKGKEIFYRLAEKADVVMESFRPGVVKRLGVDYETISKINPRIIYCALSGFGQYGPYANLAAHDLSYEAIGGMLHLDDDGRPQIPHFVLADHNATMNGTIGILMALVSRSLTGKGQFLDIAFGDGAVTIPRRQRDVMLEGYYPCFNIYQTKDGKYISLSIREPWFWERLCKLLDKEGWADKQRPEGALRDEMFAFFRETFLTKTRDEWFAALREIDTEVGPVNTGEDIMNDPHVRAREMAVQVEMPDGTKAWQVGIPFKFSETPGSIRHPVTLAGQDTDDILGELGYSPEDIASLKDADIVEATPVSILSST